jgi:hypothetical protein
MSLPITMVNDFYLEVLKGNVTGYAAKELLGLNASVGGTEDVWNQGGSITQIVDVADVAVLCISSTAAADTALEVVVTGLDANYDEITETIFTDAADGQILVNGSKLFYRVNSVTMPVAPAGKVYVYYGTTAGAGTGIPADITKVQAAVDIAGTQAYNAIYTVPRNKNRYMTSIRYRSTGSVAANNVILSVIRKIYGGANETVDVAKYLDAGTTKYTDAQIQMTDQPLSFPAKSEIRIAAGLAGGTALNIALEANFIEEDVEVAPSVVQVIDKAAYLAKLTATGKTLGGQAYWLIGLDEEPTQLPTTAILADVLAIIPGAVNYTVAADTEVTFDAAYYVSGLLINTSKKAVLTIMRCVNDDASSIDYVLAPVNTVFSLGNVKKMKFLHN